MTPDFEFNRSSWSITVSLRELLHVELAQRALNRHESDSTVTWITRGTDGRRLWITSDDVQLCWFVAMAEREDPHFALPLPDVFVGQLLDLCQVNGDIEIFCNENEGTIVGRTVDGRYVAIDHPRDVTFTKSNLPYIEHPDSAHDCPVVAEMTTAETSLFADIVQATPNHVSLGEARIPPFVTISLANDMFAWTVDWRRFGYGRQTGAVPAKVTGSVTTTFYPYNLAKFFKVHDHPGEVKVFIDGPDAEYAYFVGDSWGYRITLDREHLARWMPKLRVALIDFIDEDPAMAHRQIPDRLHFSMDGLSCVASIHPSATVGEELVRLTYFAATGVHETREVFDKINQLNSELVGVSVVLRDGEVRVVLEAPADNVENFDGHLMTFGEAIKRVSETESFLPLLNGQ
jgi:hypothetical protein